VIDSELKNGAEESSRAIQGRPEAFARLKQPVMTESQAAPKLLAQLDRLHRAQTKCHG
jgi:hypothetical protein